MTFGEALDQMRKGRVVARRSSAMFAVNGGVAIDLHGQTLRQVLGNGKWAVIREWPHTHADLLASDWEVVEAYVPKQPRRAPQALPV